jgi:predicted RNA-binding protein (virulence factor B family)
MFTWTTTKLNKYIPTELKPDLSIGQEVELKIWDFTSLGTKVIVNGMYSGLLYAQEIFQPLSVGQTVKGYVRKIREDNKIDVALQPAGIDNASNKAFDLVEYLEKNGNFLSLTDSSSPEEISKLLGISKKTFKKAIGMLYRSRQINIEENGIRLISKK